MPESERPAAAGAASLKPLLAVFWITVAVFVLLVGFIFTQQYIPHSNRLFEYVFFPGIALLVVLGVALIFMAARARITKALKYSLVLTGISAVGMPASAILHNVVYGLMMVVFGKGYWEESGGDEAVFFILALFVFPVLLIISAISSAVILARSRKKIQP